MALSNQPSSNFHHCHHTALALHQRIDRLQTTSQHVSPSVQTPPGNSAELQLLNLQIKKQQLELRLLELEAQSQARDLVATTNTKPQTVSSLDTVRAGSNSGKSQGQLDHNTCITNPQEWSHLHVPFGLSRKKFKDLSAAEFVYGYLDIDTSASPEDQPLMMQHLMSLMRLAATYDWDAVLSFHAAVLDRIESRLAAWRDDFSRIERINITESNRLKPATTGISNRNSAKPNNNNRPRNYCPEWNRTGWCSNTSHQQGVEHICAYCKLPDHTIASCPTRPPPFTTNWLALPTPASSHTSTPSPPSPVSSALSASILPVSVLPPNLTGQLSLSSNHSYAAFIRHILCSKSPHPNAFGAWISVPFKLNIPVWKSYLELNTILIPSSSTFSPLDGLLTATPSIFPDYFLLTELEHTATAGPFTCNLFPVPLRTSPLQTVPKDGSKQRVVLDLSLPPGKSVNDGIPKDFYLDQPFHLTLLRSADFVDLLLAKGAGCHLYKKDLKRAYRQISVDPQDYPFLGYHWNNCLYFDLVLPFGLRSATLACQRTTNAITHIFRTAFQHNCINYIDDFGSVETSYDEAFCAFSDLEGLFNHPRPSPTKDCLPSMQNGFSRPDLWHCSADCWGSSEQSWLYVGTYRSLAYSLAFLQIWFTIPYWQTLLHLCLHQPWSHFHATSTPGTFSAST